MIASLSDYLHVKYNASIVRCQSIEVLVACHVNKNV